MTAVQGIKKHITTNGIKQNHIANKIGMSADLLNKSLEGKRNLKADEFIALCSVLSLDLDYFSTTPEKGA